MINQTPDDKAEEIAGFAEFFLKNYQVHNLTNGIRKLTSESQAIHFLNNDKEIYSVAGLKEVYNS